MFALAWNTILTQASSFLQEIMATLLRRPALASLAKSNRFHSTISFEATSSIAVKIPTEDGYELAGTLYRANPNKAKRAAIVMGSATAVPQPFYTAYATYLSDHHGYDVLTYDYRGIGESRPENMRGFPATLSDWILQDMPASIEFTLSELEGQRDRLYIFGHSMGGQAAGLLPPHLSAQVDGMVTFSAQSGYWRLQGGNQKQFVFMSMYFILPFFARTFGYIPWSLFTSGAQDLPKGVALQWARACQKPGYILDDESLPQERYREFTSPVLAYSIDDDDWGTAKSVDRMMLNAYDNVERQHLVPSEWGLKSLGHFGFFRESSKPVWDEPVKWIESLK